ncbi:MAG TPA: winged helix DNA-binding domain-containing protein [Solirubrobacteraceae bacterium]|nr:winged helix DNA-binding domain-containing protein [Solirubrobacteraceae bacterium]
MAERVLAIQAQDPRGARLAIRARSDGLSAADVDRALTDERSLVLTWLNRGTLHLVRSEDYGWLHALTTPQLLRTGNLRRLAQEGVGADAAGRGVAVIERALADEGPLTREQLRDRLLAAGLRTEGQALIHLVFAASLRGLIIRGPMLGKQHAYVLVRDWLGAQEPVDRDRALPELARRYLAGHAPATDRDLAKWAGITLRDARAGLAAAGEQPQPGAAPLPLPPPRLLGSYDPLLHGWASRAEVLGEHDAKVVSGGLFRPFALAGGRGVATWALRDGGVELRPFARVAPAVRTALETDAGDLVRFLGQR